MDMQSSTPPPARQPIRRGREEREQLLVAFEASGLSQADFVRKHGIKLGTFRQWLYKRARRKPKPVFAPVRLTAQAVVPNVTIRLRSGTEILVPISAGLPAVAHLIDQLEQC